MSVYDVAGATRARLAVWAGAGLLATALAGTALAMAGAALGVTAGSIPAAIAWRGALGLVAVVFCARVLFERGVRVPVPKVGTAVPVLVVAAYLLDPLAWSGRALLGQLMLPQGMATFGIDLGLWVAASGVGVLWGVRSVERAEREGIRW